MRSERAALIDRVATAVDAGDIDHARMILAEHYPFTPAANAGRRYSQVDLTRVFLRDGFIDRYTGDRLVHPGALRVLAYELPDEFPYHKNGKLDRCHIAFWELLPTLDHLVPISRGGADEWSNWITTSMSTNAVKANWTLDELGWELLPPGDLREWDGMTGWFLRRCAAKPEHLRDARVRGWHRAALRAKPSAMG